ncbi:hypothetical protein PAE9249_00966 [Paenibacillus sp. CECT 9249]|nr:hypothetical protein PAE9249_00966 [Paenibacillus sp. CECT 9249]
MEERAGKYDYSDASSERFVSDVQRDLSSVCNRDEGYPNGISSCSDAANMSDSTADCLVAMFDRQFGTEEACADYLFQKKWPGGFHCPRCRYDQAYTIESRRLPLYECRACRHQTSLTAGTILEGSRTSLRKWLFAIWLVSRHCGVNAVQLCSYIGVTYKTAWSMLHKIRQAISHGDANQPLTGIVRAGQNFYGRPYNSTIFRHPQEHHLLVGVSLDPQGEPLYVKMKQISLEHLDEMRLRKSGLKAFAEQHVDPETYDVVIERGRMLFNRLPHLRKLFNQATTWINKTFRGIGPAYLQYYLDEFCFRRNMQFRNAPIMNSLLDLCMTTRPMTCSVASRQYLRTTGTSTTHLRTNTLSRYQRNKLYLQNLIHKSRQIRKVLAETLA